MYTTNLSWKPLQEVLSNLVKQELLREIEVLGNKRSRRRYEVTEIGVKVRAYFEGASKILDTEKVVI
jgi:predicted transcriptional regulator